MAVSLFIDSEDKRKLIVSKPRSSKAETDHDHEDIHCMLGHRENLEIYIRDPTSNYLRHKP